MEMFEAFNDLKDRQKEQLYRNRLEENQEIELGDGKEGGKNGSENKNATLKQKIEIALDEANHDYIPASKFEYYLWELVRICGKIRDSSWFTSIVVVTIIVVGFMLGIDSDALKRCERRNTRIESHDDDLNQEKLETCGSLFVTMVVNKIALAVFALEAGIKLIAEGNHPMRYFNDPQNGSWNRLDFFIVVIGFVEISGVSFLDFFPVVLLRLLRLLRVLRLTKAFPGLRSIVDALLSGLTSVVWICVLLVIFNYIAGCFCILIFGRNDPVHFGTVSRAMFTVFRMETLDSWDQIFNIAFYGCDEYPNGYDLLISTHKDKTCRHGQGFGFYGAFFLYCVVLFGAYILPTVLVGIVSINFNLATHRTAAVEKMNEEMTSIENMARVNI
jgi:voltage-gated sodium channel